MKKIDLTAAWRKIDQSWKTSSLAWLCGHTWLSLLAAVLFAKGWIIDLCASSPCFVYKETVPLLHGWHGLLVGMWQRWDTINYQVIAMWGYHRPDISVFFPGYPFLSHGLAVILNITDLTALLIVSNIFFWLSLVLLHRIVRSMFDIKTANRAVVFLAVFPTSIFFYAGYPQSMILFFTLFCYWQAKHNRWFLAALSAFLAGLTHGTVIPLCLMLAYQAIKTIPWKRFSLRWSLLLVPFLPMAGIAVFLSWRTVAGFSPFGQVLSIYYHRLASFPWVTLIEFFKVTFTTRISAMDIFNLALLILLVAVTVWSVKRLPLEMTIYAAALLIYSLSTRLIEDPLGSFNRYSTIFFPVYIFLGVVSARKWTRAGLVLICSLLLSLLGFYFFIWNWIG